MADITWIDAIRKVLAKAEGPLHYIDIAERIVDGGLREDKAPGTVAGSLSMSLKEDKSPFMKVARGIYALRPKPLDSVPGRITEAYKNALEQVTGAAIHYGMFWERSAVVWRANPSLMGQFQPQKPAHRTKKQPIQVDFGRQVGLYLLHDGREVVYVGRAQKESLGPRLYDHTWDTKQSRWDRFSWFGVRPVRPDGTLGDRPSRLGHTGDAIKGLIAMMEGLFIEAFEPRLNRKEQRDGVPVAEYQQIPDDPIADDDPETGRNG